MVWCRVTRHPRIFSELMSYQWTLGIGVSQLGLRISRTRWGTGLDHAFIVHFDELYDIYIYMRNGMWNSRFGKHDLMGLENKVNMKI